MISLGRLAERGLIWEQERSELSGAYVFLRTLEHRLQMEHGLQTHTVPQTEPLRTLVGRRMGFLGSPSIDALDDFDNALKLHTTNVRNAYDRCFAGADLDAPLAPSEKLHNGIDPQSHGSGEETRLLNTAATVFIAHLSPPETGHQLKTVESMSHRLSEAVHRSLNPQRALMLTARVAASLDKSEGRIELSENNLSGLVRLCGASEFFGEILAANPLLIGSLGNEKTRLRRRDYRSQLRGSIDPEKSFSGELSALRQEWSRLLVEIGAKRCSPDRPSRTGATVWPFGGWASVERSCSRPTGQWRR